MPCSCARRPAGINRLQAVLWTSGLCVTLLQWPYWGAQLRSTLLTTNVRIQRVRSISDVVPTDCNQSRLCANTLVECRREASFAFASDDSAVTSVPPYVFIAAIRVLAPRILITLWML